MSDFCLRSGHNLLLSSRRSPPGRRGVPALLQANQDYQYREMERSFRDKGGIASADEVSDMLGRHTDQPISMLARWIVDREVLSFDWQARKMVPLFQFEHHTMRLRPLVVDVIRELVPVLNDWELSLWFAHPNGWLDDAAPVDTIDVDARAVYEAARADRYLARA